MAISEQANIGTNLQTGQNVVVESDVVIGNDCTLGHNVVILAGSHLGNRVSIGDNTVIGRKPMRSRRSALPPVTDIGPCLLGDDVQVGCGCVLYSGAVLGNEVMVADLATIREAVTIGEQTIIGRGVAIENRCSIGKRCKLETDAYITAYSELEDDVFVAPMVATSNDNSMGRGEERFKHFKGATIKRGGRIGVNATILPGKVIEEEGVAAAGAVVTHDVSEKTIVAGNPARPMQEVNTDQLLKKR